MKLTYRPEIDGLRAISVGAVILYHAEISILGYQPFKGGFIGVDIFFVISGYLITAIILKELATTGSFSFKYFYERRIRRLIPALLFVMLISLLFLWIYLLPRMYLLPNSLIDFLKSILYSLGFSSNFYFHYSGQQYGSTDGLLKPFLHTWSLSVEEQYYILFPVVLLITFKYFRKYLIHIIILGFIVSLSLAEWGSKNHPSFNFYILPTRGWELLAGSTLAYLEITKGHRCKNKRLNFIMPIIGLLMIIQSFFYFNDEMSHPSFYTLSPIIGVTFILWFSDNNELVTKLLSTKLLVGIGLISYSLYLWHYPIFAFARITEFIQGNIINMIIIGLVTLALSLITYFYIEKPFRNRKKRFRFIFLIIILNYLIFLSVYFFTSENKHLIFDKKIIEFNEHENSRNYWESCSTDRLVNIKNYCKIGNYDNKIFLVGDSHLFSLVNDLGEKLNKNDYELINLTAAGTLYGQEEDKRFIQGEDKRINFLRNIKNSIFIFGGYYQRESKNDLDLLYIFYKEEFEIFLKNGNKIIFLTPIPEINFDPTVDLLPVIKNKKTDVSIKKTKVINRNKFATSFINNFNNINVLDLNNVFCDEFKCYAVTPEKIILKSDYDHASLEGAKIINDLIIKEIKKVETRLK